MATPDDHVLHVHITASRDGRRDEIIASELGVLLTALNRTLNKIALHSADFRGAAERFGSDSVNYEPSFIRLQLRSIRKGSVDLQIVVDFFSLIGLDPVTAKSILLSLIANAIWNPDQTKTFVYDFRRAVNRIARGAVGKTIEMTIKLEEASIRLQATIEHQHDVRIDVKRQPPDDTQ